MKTPRNKTPRRSPRPEPTPAAVVPHRRKDDADAFFPDPGEGPAHVEDDLAQELAEEYLIAATSGEEVGEDAFNQDVPEDHGGPFLTEPAARQVEQRVPEPKDPTDEERNTWPEAIHGPR